MKFLYCGMQNFGGPGRIGKDLKDFLQEKGIDFFWYHNTERIKPALNCSYDISITSVLENDFDCIFYNQWRIKPIFNHFNGKARQFLFLMYEDIPAYWQDFMMIPNEILSSSNAINQHLGIESTILSWAFPPIDLNRCNNNIPIIFYPIRNGGENDRKGVIQFSESLKYIKSKFSLIMLIESNIVDYYKKNAAEIFFDKRILIIERKIDDNEYLHLFSQCDAVLCTSKTSGIELALREAIALNKDILVTNIKPFNEIFNENNAWLIDCEESNYAQIETGIIEIPIFQAKPKSIADTIDNYVHTYKNSSKIKICSTIFYNSFINQLNSIFCL